MVIFMPRKLLGAQCQYKQLPGKGDFCSDIVNCIYKLISVWKNTIKVEKRDMIAYVTICSKNTMLLNKLYNFTFVQTYIFTCEIRDDKWYNIELHDIILFSTQNLMILHILCTFQNMFTSSDRCQHYSVDKRYHWMVIIIKYPSKKLVFEILWIIGNFYISIWSYCRIFSSISHWPYQHKYQGINDIT